MLKQGLHQKLLQKLSPQQIQLMKLLQVPTAELEQRIKEEIEINPALDEGTHDDENETAKDEENAAENEKQDTDEENTRDVDLDDYFSDDDTPDYKLNANNRGPDDEDRAIPIAQGTSFQESLTDQVNLRVVSEKEKEIASYIIGNLDESGYLRREVENIVDDLAFSLNIAATQQEVEKVLSIVQDLEPAGIGARNLQECLLIQLRKTDTDEIGAEIGITILESCFEEFTKKHYDKIMKKLGLAEEDLKLGIDCIIKLNPKPGNSSSQSTRSVQHVIPDFFVVEENGKLILTLNSRNAPQLKISRDYSDMLKEYGKGGEKKNKEAVSFVKQKIDAARWFIDAIKQRQNTLMITMQAILEIQQDYFLTGDETKLRPMILKDVADRVNMDISTISRVANSKYVQTHFGTFLLKSFFSESLSTDSGEEVSSREVKKILDDSIGAEDKRKPLTDDQLAKLLKDKGYNIARRTVAKYREQLNIPVARLRKEI